MIINVFAEDSLSLPDSMKAMEYQLERAPEVVRCFQCLCVHLGDDRYFCYNFDENVDYTYGKCNLHTFVGSYPEPAIFNKSENA